MTRNEPLAGTRSLSTPPDIPPPVRVAITGATGFIGRRLTLDLHRRGHRVRALVRDPRRADELLVPGVELVAGDLASPAALARLVAGCDAVIHCAGAVRGRNYSDFAPANVAGVEQMLAALRTQPPARLLVLSSLAAREPGLSPYAASKRAGERILLTQGEGVRWTILRPPAVYGPGDRELLPLFRLMARGLAAVPGQMSDRVSLLYIADLIAAITAWLQLKDPPSSVFPLSDPTDGGYSWTEIIAIASATFGRRVRPLPLPAMALDVAARVNWLGAAALGYAPMLTPAKLRELRHPDWVCDWRELGTALHWQPQVPLAEGLRLTLTTATSPPGATRS